MFCVPCVKFLFFLKVRILVKLEYLKLEYYFWNCSTLCHMWNWCFCLLFLVVSCGWIILLVIFFEKVAIGAYFLCCAIGALFFIMLCHRGRVMYCAPCWHFESVSSVWKNFRKTFKTKWQVRTPGETKQAPGGAEQETYQSLRNLSN